ncbi:MAG: GntR family transcriptional regulator [Actinomyces urogenitalis]|uniref:FadR/GntR family transcriptional regulator n=1 Tax=Actinomyces urogenitalis TaxID=103621 RepID=UPI002A83BC83|nr:GntR family transcriptional regulator [Actinomyces urogenitalis]MDY3678131.1 GntR family transcriptional regulator [Actinomyces urogenitalis]
MTIARPSARSTTTVSSDLRSAYPSLSPAPTTQATLTMQAIKDYIIQAHLQPGDPLPTESQLCEDLGVSRSSVREAVRTLVALDIVEVRHGHGTFVGQASMRPMVESLVFRGLLNRDKGYQGLLNVVELRATLDTALAPEVVRAWKGHQDPQIEATVKEMEELARQGQPFPEQDRAFHSQLLARLDNPLYRHLTDALWAVHVLLIPLLRAPEPKDILDTATSHRQMLRTAQAGDTDSYLVAIKSHYRPLLASVGR